MALASLVLLMAARQEPRDPMFEACIVLEGPADDGSATGVCLRGRYATPSASAHSRLRLADSTWAMCTTCPSPCFGSP